MINVYDFDKTIYHGDSSVHFWLYCLKRYPWLIILLPAQFINFLFIKLHITENKSLFFSFMKFIKNKRIVAEFWDSHECNLCSWYIKQKSCNDLIISASPNFLIQEIANRLNVRYIASKVDVNSGKCLSPNCKGKQKVVCFKTHYPNEQIQQCYGDSQSDRFIMSIAHEAYYVKNKDSKNVIMTKYIGT